MAGMEIVRHFTDVLRERLAAPLNHIQVVLGPRQVGKTTGLRQLAESWNGPIHMVTADEVLPPRPDWIDMNWRDGRDEVDFVVDSDDGLFAIEVKSGRTRRTSGLAAFCKRYPKAVPVLVDHAKAERLLRGSSVSEIVVPHTSS